MQSFKIEHLKKDRPGRRIPWFETLDAREAETLRTTLATRLGLDSAADGLSIVRHLDGLALPLDAVSAASDEFDLADLFHRLGIKRDPDVYVNWYRFDEIDRMHFDELAQQFDSIWYPGADDIDLFDSSLAWVLEVTHEGAVKLLRLGTNAQNPDVSTLNRCADVHQAIPPASVNTVD